MTVSEILGFLIAMIIVCFVFRKRIIAFLKEIKTVQQSLPQKPKVINARWNDIKKEEELK